MAANMTAMAASIFASYVFKKLGDLVFSEITLSGDIRDDVVLLREELQRMQAFLEDAATMEATDYRINIFIEHVRELAVEAEDAIDTLSVHLGNAEPRSFRSRFAIRTKSHDFGTQIKKLKRRVEDLTRQMETYQIRLPDTVIQTGVPPQRIRLGSIPYVQYQEVIGLDWHVQAVEDLLSYGGSRRLVVSVVGMGGIGKTTLAKKLYDNLTRHSLGFDYTTWVSVSQKYKKYSLSDLLRSIARDILKLSQKDEHEMNQDTIRVSVCQFLRSKKYLIVLDDVWSSQVWDTLRAILPDPNNGSRVIITTRVVEVARLANPNMPPYKLPALNEEESRILFTKRAFPNEENAEQLCTGELASLRDKILEKCRGLPLAIIVVGGLLSVREKSPREWRKVAEKIEWRQTEKGEQCMGILALSYTDLPVYLKWCFLYLAAIPEDCVFSGEHLKRLWVAEGLIEEREGKALEDTAERYLEELVQRCLFQLDSGRLLRERVCRVHDMVLELAVLEAKKTWFLDVWRSGPVSNPGGALMRRLSITHDSAEIDLPLESNKLRTLLISDRRDWEYYYVSVGYFTEKSSNINWPSSVHKNLELLRVLQLSGRIPHLPEGIADMTKLRYLKLSSPKIKELPSSLGNLQNLQTLDVRRTCVEVFPQSIWKIRTLRYVHGRIEGDRTRFPEPEASIPRDIFKNLRALEDVSADPWMEEILPNSINLRTLEILDGGVSSMSRYLPGTINQLQRLNRLVLSTNYCDIIKMDEIFSSLECHIDLQTLLLNNSKSNIASLHLSRLPQNLKEVYFGGIKINRDILGLLGKLKNLHELILDTISIIGEEKMVFSSGWFPQLHALRLYALDIKRWEVEKESLPLLRTLYILGCRNLEELPEGLEHIMTMKHLWVSGGHEKLREMLRRPGGPDWYKVQHIPSILLDGVAVSRLPPSMI